MAMRRFDLAAKRKTDRTGARGGPIRATIKAQRVGACLSRVGHPQQLEEPLGPHQAPVACPLTAVRLASVQHPPVVHKSPRGLSGVGHHAEDVVEFEQDHQRR